MYLGVDGYKNGWCCCNLENDISFSTHQNIQSIIELYANYYKIFIDIPIGLSSIENKRLIDEKLRKHLPKGKKAVFSMPPQGQLLSVKTIMMLKQKKSKFLEKAYLFNLGTFQIKLMKSINF